MNRTTARTLHRYAIAVLGVLMIVPSLAAADPLTLIDPFPSDANIVGRLSAELSKPDAGIGSNALFDFQLPFSGARSFSRATGQASASASMDTVAGHIRADVVNGAGNASVDRTYTLDLPTGVELSTIGGRAAALLLVWGPSPNGQLQGQNPGLYGVILWEAFSSFDQWQIFRDTWGALSDPPVELLLASGNDLDTFNWSALASDVSDIANGRAIGYYEVIVDAGLQGFFPEDKNSHARMNFAPVPEPSTLILLAWGASFAMRRRRKSAA